MFNVNVVSHNYIGNKHLQSNELIYTTLRYFKKGRKQFKTFPNTIRRTGRKMAFPMTCTKFTHQLVIKVHSSQNKEENVQSNIFHQIFPLLTNIFKLDYKILF